MQRYFIELSYKGTRYSGFQVQKNAKTIQGEIEKALEMLLKVKINLTGSSRTDSGVHAFQNYFHFDWIGIFNIEWIYNINAILPNDIVIKEVKPVSEMAHCRFDAVSRTYAYKINQFKNAFLNETAYFYPYPIDLPKMNEAAALLKIHTNFSSFSKKNTQVKTFNCIISESEWTCEDKVLLYRVTANRFLRGMVRALVATMLKVGRGVISIKDFKKIIEAENFNKAYFNAPAHGLTLIKVDYGLK